MRRFALPAALLLAPSPACLAQTPSLQHRLDDEALAGLKFNEMVPVNLLRAELTTRLRADAAVRHATENPLDEAWLPNA